MAKRKFTLARKRANYVKNRDVTLVGYPMQVNQASVDRMTSLSSKMVDKMAKDLDKTIKGVLLSDQIKHGLAMDASLTAQMRAALNKLDKKWTKLFSEFGTSWSKRLSTDVTKQTARDTERNYEKLSGGMSINVNSMSQRSKDIIAASTDEAASLIKSVGPNYMSDVRESVMRSITTEQGYAGLTDKIHNLLSAKFKKHKNKAKLISMDQTRKAYQGLARQRLIDSGMSKFRWKHSGGSQQPRSYHRDELDGNIYDLNDPPIIDKNTGERGYPGQLIHCRCIMLPVIEFNNG